LNGANYDTLAVQITALLRNKGLWMYLAKPLLAANDENCDFICLKKDKALRLITWFVEPDLIHHSKDNKGAKEICDTFKSPFGIVNTTQVNQLETKLSIPKMGDFGIVEE
jgi:hypothetical protein